MNCEEFGDWLHSHLDDRTNPEAKYEVRAHLDECELCRGQMQAWQQISTILPAGQLQQAVELPDSPPQKKTTSLMAALAAAASLIIAVIYFQGNDAGSDVVTMASAKTTIEPEPVPSNRSIATTSQVVTNQDQTNDGGASLAIDPVHWWRSVDQQNWIDNTIPKVMPTVESMRNGVAPLGRSLFQAVTLLTRFSGDQTS